MNRILLCIVFMGTALMASSQKVYFIYVQAESGQAFYLKMNEKIFSSTASGYLILSKLRDSTYSFSIGFPGNKWPDQQFTVSVDRKDHGYLLKNFGEKGWGLFNLQTLAVIMAAQNETKKDGARNTENKDASDFTNILSKAADDPTLKEKPVRVTSPEPQTEIVKEPDPKAPLLVKTEVAGKPADDPVGKEKPAPAKTEEVAKEPAAGEPLVVKTEVVEKPAVDPALKEKPVSVKTEDPKTAGKESTERSADSSLTEVKNKPAGDLPLKENQGRPGSEETKPVAVAQPENKNPAPVVPGGAAKEEPGSTAPVIKENSPQTQTRDTLTLKTESTEKPSEQPVTVTEEPVTAGQSVETEKTAAYKPSVVTRRSESSTTDGFGLTFTDLYGEGMADTIRILIPNPKPVVVPVTGKQEIREERKFLATDSVTADAADLRPEEVKPEEKPLVNTGLKNNCAAVADDNDFLRIRKKMAAETTDDNMIAEAKKIFKTKCFSTLQIKNLGTLFLNDEGKYRFFDAAYAYVTDPGNYPSLETEMKDAYYINRFKAMLRS